ncbi:MAG TPA: pantoate--beta-alanine ligase [Chitinophagaceae bacterium]|nr:pantoate--beta-alanine ligase [Chitinophagaceae bacterium]
MILFKKANSLHQWVDAQQRKGQKVGFVPTMGALHLGHISLIESSRKDNDITISSIFVNPTQFNDPKDFEKYPVTIEKDILQLEQAGCDVLFLPSVEEIYPNGTTSKQHYDLGEMETLLEGKFRPGHYQGVCQVVHRLLEIVHPDNLYLGQKDYQQCMVISRLVELMGINDKTNINICPTLRETDGLAMSSRNMRLSEAERVKAVLIFQSLSYIKDNLVAGETDTIKNKAIAMLSDEGFRVDYIEIADAKTLEPLSNWDGKKKLVALAAAFLNEVRLIDNLLLN